MNIPDHHRLQTYLYFTTVFLTGAAVLIFEVAAVRMLAPYFGSSLYVLSSVLTTILAALSIGYYIGGRIADKLPTPTVLYTIIGSAGIVMLLLLVLSQYILPSVNTIFSITTGPLILSLTLFFIPALLLGIDSPFVIKLLGINGSTENSGEVVGSTFFFSTIGSILGSISAGFFLIPFLGLTLTIMIVSILLVIWSIIAIIVFSKINHPSVPDDPILKRVPLPLLCTIGACSALYISYLIINVTPPTSADITLYQKDGYYSNIHIFEQARNGTTYRFLKNDVNSSSAIIPGSNELVFSYTQFADIFTDNDIVAQKYLVLGGGSYTIPRTIHALYPDIDITVAEVEPSLFPLSHQFFELPITSKIENQVIDARVFLQSTTTQFDVIFSDVMNSGLFIPPHLSTVEFFESFKQRLAPRGIAIINFIGSLDTNETNLTGSMLKTIARVFPNYQLVALRGKDYLGVQNILFVVRHDTLPINIPDRNIKDHHTNTLLNSQTMIVAKEPLYLDNQVVFTDDTSQVEPLILKQFANVKLR